jgi:hypothetical protein
LETVCTIKRERLIRLLPERRVSRPVVPAPVPAPIASVVSTADVEAPRPRPTLLGG